MPFYPSNIYPNLAGVGFSRSGILTTNHPGSNYINNLTSYQELKDTVVGIGYSFNGVGVLTANDLAGAGTSFFSAAKYPTDVNVGVENISTQTHFVNDFASMLNTLEYEINAIQTSFASVTAIGSSFIAASSPDNTSFITRDEHATVNSGLDVGNNDRSKLE